MTTSDLTKRQASIDRATSKALAMARRGARPTVARTDQAPDGLSTTVVYGVPSGSVPGRTYLVTVIGDCDGLHSACDCQAGASDVPCWHRALCRLDALGELPAPAALPDEWEISGKRRPVSCDERAFVNFAGMAAD